MSYPSDSAKTQRALPRVGDLVSGKYRIEREIGEGGMGVVYEVFHPFFNERYALKMLRPETDANEVYRQRFDQEMKILGALRHLNNKHLTRIIDLGSLDGAPYIVMELLRGQDLRQELDLRKNLPAEEAIDYILQACDGLAGAHQRGIVHRDIKPENLFLHEEDGRTVLKVVDFGIARAALPGGRRLTDFVPPRTEGYAPREQMEGRDADARADIFALGVVLHELVAGEHPFPDCNVRVPRKPLEGDANLDKVIEVCLRTDPKRRFPNVSALAEALANLKTPGGVERRETAKNIASAQDMTVEAAGRKFHSPEKLEQHLRGRTRHVMFLFGAGLTEPRTKEGPGVPGAAAMVGLIRDWYKKRGHQDLLQGFERAVGQGDDPYRRAFEYLAESNPDQPNVIVRQAVLRARKKLLPEDEWRLVKKGDKATCAALEGDVNGWFISEGLDALAWLMKNRPTRFEHRILTSNFDPLISVALRRHGVRATPIVLAHNDGIDWTHGAASGCQVVHFHGDWFRSDTLHTEDQLKYAREKLTSSILDALSEGTLVVMGYGGWDDVMTNAIIGAFDKPDVKADVIWTFREDDPVQIHSRYRRLIQALSNGLLRNRVHFYRGVDVHQFLPMLRDKERQALDSVQMTERSGPPPPPQVSNPVPVPPMLGEHVVAPEAPTPPPRPVPNEHSGKPVRTGDLVVQVIEASRQVRTWIAKVSRAALWIGIIAVAAFLGFTAKRILDDESKKPPGTSVAPPNALPPARSGLAPPSATSSDLPPATPVTAAPPTTAAAPPPNTPPVATAPAATTPLASNTPPSRLAAPLGAFDFVVTLAAIPGVSTAPKFEPGAGFTLSINKMKIEGSRSGGGKPAWTFKVPSMYANKRGTLIPKGFYCEPLTSSLKVDLNTKGSVVTPVNKNPVCGGISVFCNEKSCLKECCQ